MQHTRQQEGGQQQESEAEVVLQADEPVQQQRAEDKQAQHDAPQQQLLISLQAVRVQAHEIQRRMQPVCLQEHIVEDSQGIKRERQEDECHGDQDEQQRNGQLQPDMRADLHPQGSEDEQEGKEGKRQL